MRAGPFGWTVFFCGGPGQLLRRVLLECVWGSWAGGRCPLLLLLHTSHLIDAVGVASAVLGLERCVGEGVCWSFDLQHGPTRGLNKSLID